MNTVSRLIAAAALSAASLSAHAELQARPGGMVYDTVQNITWLADFNYAKTSGYDTDGLMDWVGASAWADSLVHGGISGWRLPSALNADRTGPCATYYNCAASEMGHLFYVDWGAVAARPYFEGSNADNLALFTNVQVVGPAYWTSTEVEVGSIYVWGFFVGGSGGQPDNSYKLNEMFAVAVRDGDVAAAVPEPQTNAMLLAGLGALALLRRKR